MEAMAGGAVGASNRITPTGTAATTSSRINKPIKNLRITPPNMSLRYLWRASQRLDRQTELAA